MSKAHENLYDLIEEFLDTCDSHIDCNKNLDVRGWYKKINKALDEVYRAEAGMPHPPRMGRPPKEADSHGR